jgi:hypothetical protein
LQNIVVTAHGASQTVNCQSFGGGYYFSSRVANTGSDYYEHITVTKGGQTIEDGDQYFPEVLQSVSNQ